MIRPGLRRGVVLACSLMVACGGGGGGARPDASGDRAGTTDGDATTADTAASDATDAAGATDARDGGGGDDDALVAIDLQGAWYAPVLPGDGGVARHQRLRFDGATYYLVYNTPFLYCGEVGTFEVSGSEIRFQPDHVEGGPGPGQLPAQACPAAAARTERLARTPAGVLVGAGEYVRARAVPKVFVTFELHDGNLAGDPDLPGAFAVEKADAICNRSIARPDGASYKALLVDGILRSAIPPRDWVLAPNTTYYQADGVLNVFTADQAGLSDTDTAHAVVSDGPGFQYAWTGIGFDFLGTSTCRNFTSNSRNDLAQLGSVGGARPFASVSGTCSDSFQFLCVTSPVPARGDGGADGGGAHDPDLQGSWSTASAPDAGARAPRQRLRFDSDRYYLVSESEGFYCGEVGTFRETTAAVAFAPERIHGYGPCTIGRDRLEILTKGSGEITLSLAGLDARYVRAPDVPKVFATMETHDGNFAADTLLPGTTPIAKADAFCERSAARPDGRPYKALLVDRRTRGASPPLDWVLRPSTLYFNGNGLGPAFRTDASGFPTLGADSRGFLFIQFGYMWTSLASNFTLASNSCNGWTSSDAALSGSLMDASGPYVGAGSVVGTCNSRGYGILCVGQ